MSNDSSQKKDNLKQQAVSSTAWGFMDKGVGVGVQFIIGIVLARLLPPADFGLIGLGMIVVGFGQVFVNLGLGPAMIQKQDLTERHVRVVFTTSIIAGVILAAIFYFSAPLMAVVLGNENVTPIVSALSVIFVIAAFQIPSKSLLKKKLDFRHLFYVNLTTRLLYGIVTIILALYGWGVWSLVVGNILQRLTSFLGNYYYISHSIKPLLAKNEFFDLFHFGSGMTLSGIFNYFALQGDYFIIGRILGAEALGLYTRAYALMQTPTTKFVSVLSNVLFPAASRIQQDENRLKKVFLKAMHIIAFISIPACTLLIILAPELIIGLYGDNWIGTIVPLQILSLFGFLRAMYNASAAFLKAKGWVYSILFAQVVYGITMVGGVWLGASSYGLEGAAWSVGFAIFIMWVILMELNSRAMSIPRFQIIKTLIPGFIISTFIAIPTLIANQFVIGDISSNIFRLIISFFIALICFSVAVLYSPQSLFHFLPSEILMMSKNYLPPKLYSSLLNIIKFKEK